MKASFYDDMKQQFSDQAQRNRAEFEGMAREQRVVFEGVQPGMYVRIEIKASLLCVLVVCVTLRLNVSSTQSVPCEFVQHFDPTYPVIVGGVLPGEERLAYVRLRLKRHRWHHRTLKSHDPLIVSIGWRRFQTVLVYSMDDHNGRQRMIKYTPEHMFCTATFFG